MPIEIPQETRLRIIQAWDEGQSVKPKISKTALGEIFGLHPQTIRDILKNRDAVQARTALEQKYGGWETVKVGNPDIIRKSPPDYKKSADIPETGMSVVLAIPDLHCPFNHIDALDFLKAVRDAYLPTKIVCLGDEVDFHAYSKWPKDPDGLSPGKELQAAIEALIPFYLAFPEVQVCVSNHTIRPGKMMKLMGLPAAFLPAYSTMLNAPDGWSWHEHIIIDNVRYMHGDQGKGGVNGWTKNSEVYHQSVVVGHWHSKAGVFYDGKMFNVNSGCLIDDTAYAFDYAKNNHKRPNLGCTIVSHGIQAQFIPMITNSEGRWVGSL